MFLRRSGLIYVFINLFLINWTYCDDSRINLADTSKETETVYCLYNYDIECNSTCLMFDFSGGICQKGKCSCYGHFNSHQNQNDLLQLSGLSISPIKCVNHFEEDEELNIDRESDPHDMKANVAQLHREMKGLGLNPMELVNLTNEPTKESQGMTNSDIGNIVSQWQNTMQHMTSFMMILNNLMNKTSEFYTTALRFAITKDISPEQTRDFLSTKKIMELLQQDKRLSPSEKRFLADVAFIGTTKDQKPGGTFFEDTLSLPSEYQTGVDYKKVEINKTFTLNETINPITSAISNHSLNYLVTDLLHLGDNLKDESNQSKSQESLHFDDSEVLVMVIPHNYETTSDKNHSENRQLNITRHFGDDVANGEKPTWEVLQNVNIDEVGEFLKQLHTVNITDNKVINVPLDFDFLSSRPGAELNESEPFFGVSGESGQTNWYINATILLEVTDKSVNVELEKSKSFRNDEFIGKLPNITELRANALESTKENSPFGQESVAPEISVPMERTGNASTMLEVDEESDHNLLTTTNTLAFGVALQDSVNGSRIYLESTSEESGQTDAYLVLEGGTTDSLANYEGVLSESPEINVVETNNGLTQQKMTELNSITRVADLLRPTEHDPLKEQLSLEEFSPLPPADSAPDDESTVGVTDYLNGSHEPHADQQSHTVKVNLLVTGNNSEELFPHRIISVANTFPQSGVDADNLTKFIDVSSMLNEKTSKDVSQDESQLEKHPYVDFEKQKNLEEGIVNYANDFKDHMQNQSVPFVYLRGSPSNFTYNHNVFMPFNTSSDISVEPDIQLVISYLIRQLHDNQSSNPFITKYINSSTNLSYLKYLVVILTKRLKEIDEETVSGHKFHSHNAVMDNLSVKEIKELINLLSKYIKLMEEQLLASSHVTYVEVQDEVGHGTPQIGLDSSTTAMNEEYKEEEDYDESYESYPTSLLQIIRQSVSDIIHKYMEARNAGRRRGHRKKWRRPHHPPPHFGAFAPFNQSFLF